MSAPVMAAAAVVQAIGTQKKGSADARALRNQAGVASAQGYADEAAQRRDARQVLGSQAAAMAQAGGGSGGTNALVANQSAVMAELDALNIRYGAQNRSNALINEARATKKESLFMAGSQLLSAGSRYNSQRKIEAMGG